MTRVEILGVLFRSGKFVVIVLGTSLCSLTRPLLLSPPVVVLSLTFPVPVLTPSLVGVLSIIISVSALISSVVVVVISVSILTPSLVTFLSVIFSVSLLISPVLTPISLTPVEFLSQVKVVPVI